MMKSTWFTETEGNNVNKYVVEMEDNFKIYISFDGKEAKSWDRWLGHLWGEIILNSSSM